MNFLKTSATHVLFFFVLWDVSRAPVEVQPILLIEESQTQIPSLTDHKQITHICKYTGYFFQTSKIINIAKDVEKTRTESSLYNHPIYKQPHTMYKIVVQLVRHTCGVEKLWR